MPHEQYKWLILLRQLQINALRDQLASHEREATVWREKTRRELEGELKQMYPLTPLQNKIMSFISKDMRKRIESLRNALLMSPIQQEGDSMRRILPKEWSSKLT